MKDWEQAEGEEAYDADVCTYEKLRDVHTTFRWEVSPMARVMDGRLGL